MSTRAYKRDSHGRFAGAAASGGGFTVTYGKAGGFANQAFRLRVLGQRASSKKSLGLTANPRSGSNRHTGIKDFAKAVAREGVPVATAGFTAATTLLVTEASSSRSTRLTGRVIAAVNAGGTYALTRSVTATPRATTRKSRPRIASGKRLAR